MKLGAVHTFQLTRLLKLDKSLSHFEFYSSFSSYYCLLPNNNAHFRSRQIKKARFRIFPSTRIPISNPCLPRFLSAKTHLKLHKSLSHFEFHSSFSRYYCLLTNHHAHFRSRQIKKAQFRIFPSTNPISKDDCPS